MRSCNTLRCPTLNATTSKCIVSNQCSRNCSTLNPKIVSVKLIPVIHYNTFFRACLPRNRACGTDGGEWSN